MTRLLLVEDNELNRDMLSRRLTRAGFEVAVSCDGIHGIAAARAHPPDLIVMDLSLPQMDGWTATRILKSDQAVGRIPVIALTAHAMSGEREKALAAGCDAFETKPVDIAHLIGTINRLLKERYPTPC